MAARSNEPPDQTSRPIEPGMIHHNDAGSQYTSVRFTETMALEGLTASIRSVGDAYDNAAAETAMGLFKNEAITKNSPFPCWSAQNDRGC